MAASCVRKLSETSALHSSMQSDWGPWRSHPSWLSPCISARSRSLALTCSRTVPFDFFIFLLTDDALLESECPVD